VTATATYTPHRTATMPAPRPPANTTALPARA
jgi:hypothetical protein